jgi:hypothetical protein
MTEAEWLACEDPLPMLQFLATQESDRKRRLFLVACCRRVTDIMTDGGRGAVDAAEAFADGEIGVFDLLLARRTVGRPKGEKRYYAAAAARAASLPPSNDSSIHGAAWAVNAAAKKRVERAVQAGLLRDVFGNPFRPVVLDPSWRTVAVVDLARGIYEERAFDRMPILGDALEDAGCDSADVIAHCRDEKATHVRGCWVVDLVLGKV